MQMIDVLKRLAELDADNPRVEKVAMTNEQSLATVSNIEGETITENVNECGPMGMMGGMDRPTTPATFSINASAQSGDEVSSMLRDIMNLAGVKAAGSDMSMGDLDHDGDHDMQDHEIELGAPHAVELEPQGSAGDEMGSLIGMIDKMNGPADDAGSDDKMGNDEGPTKSVADMADEVEGMTAQLKDEGVGAGFDAATTTPDEKVEPHKYGNDQVTPKPAEPLKKAGAGNPYNESIEQVSLQLLKAYEEFKKQ
jgi:hypothetical protein